MHIDNFTHNYVHANRVSDKKSYNETENTQKKKKRVIAHPWVFRGTESAPFVPAQDFRAQGNSFSPTPRHLSTAFLAWTKGKLPKHQASASSKSRNISSTGDFTATQLKPALACSPTLTGGVSNTSSMSLLARTPAATLINKERRQ